MNSPRADGVPRTDRRGFLAAAAVAALGGCSEGTDDGSGADGEATPDGQRTGGRTLDRARADLETVYRRLEAVPVAEDGEFVFDVGAFESEFDHEAVVADASAVRDRLEVHDADGAAREGDALAAAAELAGLLARQRLSLHQAVAAGLTFEERFARAEFGPAAGAVRDGRAYVDGLVSNGERIEAVLAGRDGPLPAVDGYDPASVREAQSVLAEVTLWTGPAYEGLGRAADGFDAFAAANDAMERERFGTAAGRLDRARERFEAAEAAFDRAAGGGRRMDYVAPTVDEVRCAVPAYVEGCDRLGDALAAIDAGDRSRGFDLARATLDEMDRTVGRCMEAGLD